MKARKLLIGFALVVAVLVAVWVLLPTSLPTIDPPTAEALSVTTDRWCEQPADRGIPPEEWPDEVQRLRPQSVRVSPDGVYIQQGSWLVEEWGVFIHRTGSNFRPSQGTDPSHRPLQGRVYWYEIKG